MDLKLFLILCSTITIFAVNGKSLTFVTDTTVSMKEELILMKRQMRNFVNDIRSVSIDKFISLPFDSNDHFESSTTWDLDAFSRSISRLQPSGGTLECPENSLAAIQKALEISDEGSHVFVFTDAYARENDAEGIKRLCKIKKSRVVIFLTGYCLPTDQHPSGLESYYEVTSACAGALFIVNSDEMSQVFTIAKEMIKSEWTEVKTERSSTGYITIKVPVFSSTSDLVLAVTGDDPAVEVTHEGGSQTGLEKIVDTRYSTPGSQYLTTQMVRAKHLRIGTYTIDIRSRGQISATVFTKKDFPFSYGFSAASRPRSIKETSRRPMPGRDNKILIEIPNELNNDINNAELLTERGDRVILSLNKISERPKLYLSSAFKVQEPFKLSVYGKDLNTYKDFVETTSMLEPQINNAKPEFYRPTIEPLDSEYILVESGSTVSLACKVSGYPEPSMTWYDENNIASYTPENVLLEIPSTHISYLTISNVVKNNTFNCKAENRAGYSDISYQVFVKKDYYIEEITVPVDQTIQYGHTGRLECTVKSVPKATIKWYYNETSVYFNDRFDVSSIDNSLTIKSMGLEEIGQYKCEVSTIHESKTFTAFVSISGLESPRINNTEASAFTWSLGSREELKCRVTKGIPTPEITWMFKPEKASEFSSIYSDLQTDGDKLVFKNVHQHHKGTYKCVATNVEGDDSKEFTVMIRLPPKIQSAKEEYVNIKENSALELPCLVDAKAEVWWEHWKRGGRAASDERHRVDHQHTLSFAALQKDSGEYRCIARNDVGEDVRVVHVNVLVRPYIKTPEYKEITAKVGTKVVMPCRLLHGNPAPTSHWEFVSMTDGAPEPLPGSSSDLILASVTAEQAGSYTCVARNSIGTDSIKIKLIVVN